MQNENNMADEETIDLLELFFVLMKHAAVIIITALIAGIGTFLFTKLFVTPQYSATSELFVLQKSTSLTSLADIQLSSQLTNDYLIVVVDRPVLDQVIANLRLDETYTTLKKKIELTNPSNSRILYITVTDADPLRAKLIADEIADVASAFIAEKMDQDAPSILSYGYADGEKVSPSTLKNTIIGALIGGVLACGIVILFYLINDTIRTSEDVEKKLGLKLLAQIPNDEEEENKKKKKRKGGEDKK